MMEEKVLEKRFVPIAEVKELLKERAKDSELTYEQSLTAKYAEKFSHLSKAKAEKLIEELKEIEGMNDEFAIKLADVLPSDKELLELMVPKHAKIKNEDVDKILKIIKKHFDRGELKIGIKEKEKKK